MTTQTAEQIPTSGLASRVAYLGWSLSEFENLSTAHERSAQLIETARTRLVGMDLPDSVDVLALGSLGRHEISSESDLDGLLVNYGTEPLFTASEAKELLSELGTLLELRPPGRTGMFGVEVFSSDLHEIIGLDADTNQRHSRRVLVLEESVSLRSPNRHRELLQTMVDRYIDAIPPSRSNVPRFLVNDLARYWRQLTVDYQAKSEQSEQSALRRLKLMVTRKFTYAASVLPILTHEIRKSERLELVNGIVGAYQNSAVVRFLDEIAALRDMTSDPELIERARQVLCEVDAFNSLLADSSWRKALTGVNQPEAEKSDEFATGRDIARNLQENLDNLFFSHSLQGLTRKYLVF